MRGSKLTKHSGLKHGLGGQTFQKGTMVGKRIMADSLDQKMPIMELTFCAEKQDEAPQEQMLLALNGGNVFQLSNQQRLVIGSQAFSSAPSSPTQKPHSPTKLQLSGGRGSPHVSGGGVASPNINVDLHRLTKKLPGQHTSSVTQRVMEHSFRNDHTAGHDLDGKLELELTDTINRSKSSMKAVLVQNDSFNSVLPRTASGRSLHASENTNLREDTGVMPDDTRLDPRPIHTQNNNKEAADGRPEVDGSVTPNAFNDQSELTSTPSQFFEQKSLPRMQLAINNQNTSNRQRVAIGKNRVVASVDRSKIIKDHQSAFFQATNKAPVQPSRPARVQVFDPQLKQAPSPTRPRQVIPAKFSTTSNTMTPRNVQSPTPTNLQQPSFDVSPQPQGPHHHYQTQQLQNQAAVMITTATQANFSPLMASGKRLSDNSVGYQQYAINGGEGQRALSRFELTGTQGNATGSFNLKPPQQAPTLQGGGKHLSDLNVFGDSGASSGQVNALHQHTFGAMNFGNSQAHLASLHPAASTEQVATELLQPTPRNKQFQLNQSSNEIVPASFSGDDLPKEEFRRAMRNPTSLLAAMQQVQSQIEQEQQDELNNKTLKLKDAAQFTQSESSISSVKDKSNLVGELHHGQPTSPILSRQSGILTQVESGQFNAQSTAGKEVDIVRKGDYQVKVDINKSLPEDLQLDLNLGQKGPDRTQDDLKSPDDPSQRQSQLIESVLLNDKHLLHTQEGEIGLRERKSLASVGSSSVDRALNQIETYGQSADLTTEARAEQEIYIMQGSDVQQLATIQSSSNLAANTTSSMAARSLSRQRRSPNQRGSPDRRREVLPLATVNIMSGAVTHEKTRKAHVQTTYKQGGNFGQSLLSPNGAATGSQKAIEVAASVENVMGTRVGFGQGGGGPRSGDNLNHGAMNRTVFVQGKSGEFSPYQTTSLLDNANNVKVSFRDTTYGARSGKMKNLMFRTTLGLRDEASSDTVSTEFNYLQPTVRRMNVNQRASLHKTTSQGDVSNINVQEQVVSGDPHDLSIGQQSSMVNQNQQINTLTKGSPRSPIQVTNKNISDSSPATTQQQLQTDTTPLQRRQLMIDQDSQILFDTPLMVNAPLLPHHKVRTVRQSPSLSKGQSGRPSPTHQMRSQLSKSTLVVQNNGAADVKRQNHSQMRGSHLRQRDTSDSPSNQRSISKLSLDLRKAAAAGTKDPSINKDFGSNQGTSFVTEPNTALFVQDQFSPGIRAPDQTPQEREGSADQVKVERNLEVENFIEATKNSDILNGPISVRQTNQNSEENEQSPRITTVNLIKIGEQSADLEKSDAGTTDKPLKSSVLIKGGSSIDSKQDASRQTSSVVSKVAAVGSKAETQIKRLTVSKLHDQGGSKRALNETACFRPQPIQLFDPPNLENVASMKALQTVSSQGRNSPIHSPLKLRTDHSKSLLSQKKLKNEKSKPKIQIAPLPGLGNILSLQQQQLYQTQEKLKIDVRDKRLNQPAMLAAATSSFTMSQKDDEMKHLSRTQSQHRQTTQSFATVLVSTESPTNQHHQLDNKYDSKLTSFIPALYNKNFSQTYADLLKNIGPYDVKSEVTDSEYAAYPTPVFKSAAKLELMSPETLRKGGKALEERSSIEMFKALPPTGMVIEQKQSKEGGGDVFVSVDDSMTEAGLQQAAAMAQAQAQAHAQAQAQAHAQAQAAAVKQSERMAANPELQFYMKILERMRNTHKDVVSVEAVQELRNTYKKYLAESETSGRGLFADLMCQKIEKPSITMSNETSHDPMLQQLRTERNLYKQYNIAAITANGVDNLPRRWKKLSPINRFKTKIKIDRYEKKLKDQRESMAGGVSPMATSSKERRGPKGRQVSHSVDLDQLRGGKDQSRIIGAGETLGDSMFHSLISSQEFEIKTDHDWKVATHQAKQLQTHQNFEFQALLSKDQTEQTINARKVHSGLASQAFLDKINQSSHEGVISVKERQKRNSPEFRDPNRNQVLRQTQTQSPPLIRSPKRDRSRRNLPDNNLTTMSLDIQKMPISPHKKTKSNGSAEATLEPDGSTLLQENLIKINQDSRSQMLEEKHLASDQVQQLLRTINYDHDLSQSLDPASLPQNPGQLLARQRSQFADLLTFGKGKPKGIKERVGAAGTNPFLTEIEERLRNPDARKALLTKSLVTRDAQVATHNSKWKPNVQKDKTIKIATRDIYDSVRVQKTIPAVPLHRMDLISRNLTVSLLDQTASERVPMRDWQRQEVMLPILNTAKRNVTLHTSVELAAGDIQRQKRLHVDLVQQREKAARRNQIFMRSLDPLIEAEKAANRNKRGLSQLSMLSWSTPTNEKPNGIGNQGSRLGMASPASLQPPMAFNNQMLRRATEQSLSDADSKMKIISRASKMNVLGSSNKA